MLLAFTLKLKGDCAYAFHPLGMETARNRILEKQGTTPGHLCASLQRKSQVCIEAIVANFLGSREDLMAAIREQIYQHNKLPNFTMLTPTVRFALEVQQVKKFHRRAIETSILQSRLIQIRSTMEPLLKRCHVKPIQGRSLKNIDSEPSRTSFFFSATSARELQLSEATCLKTFLLPKDALRYKRPSLEKRLVLVDEKMTHLAFFTGAQRRNLKQQTICDSKAIAKLPGVILLSAAQRSITWRSCSEGTCAQSHRACHVSNAPGK